MRKIPKSFQYDLICFRHMQGQKVIVNCDVFYLKIKMLKLNHF